MITVYFTNNNNWSKVYAYTWGGSKKAAAWPGDAMTYVVIQTSIIRQYTRLKFLLILRELYLQMVQETRL